LPGEVHPFRYTIYSNGVAPIHARHDPAPRDKGSKLRTLRGAILLALIAALLWVGSARLGDRRLHERIEHLEADRDRFQKYASRLASDRRVAQVRVESQFRNAQGQPVTRLLWQEIGPSGIVSSPVYIEPVGSPVYFEAAVIKFDHDLVARAAPERAGSVALFRRVFGGGQSPDSAPMLDGASTVGAKSDTAPSRSPNGAPSDIEAIRAKFWDFVEYPLMAADYGVRVAQLEAPAAPMRAGQVWEVSLDAAGGLNLRKLRESNGRVVGRSLAPIWATNEASTQRRIATTAGPTTPSAD
jgi:hypothetical protein